MIRLDAATAEVIGRAMAACKEHEHEWAKEYEHPKPHDMRECTDEDKRRTYQQAMSGQMGERWRTIAKSEDIGVFLWLYEHWMQAPTDEQLARMWTDWTPETDRNRQAGGDHA
jgi:hypothetical protein